MGKYADLHPWMGLEAFGFEHSDRFFGRDREIRNLSLTVQRNLLTLLFSKSGMGKTSLLRAGLCADLDRQGLVPIYIRLNYSDPSRGLVEQIWEALEVMFEVRGREQFDSVWEWLHEKTKGLLSYEGNLDADTPPVPVFIFDQFEEIFTLGRSEEWSEHVHSLLVELGDLAENRIPQLLRRKISDGAVEASSLQFDYRSSSYRLVFGLREDFLAELERSKKNFPSIMKNRFLLDNLGGEAALAAVTGPAPPDLISRETGEAIVRIVSGCEAKAPLQECIVEPALLSLICRELNQIRIDRGLDEISQDLLQDVPPTEILEDYYEESFRGLNEGVRDYIEENLVTDSGHRNSRHLQEVHKNIGKEVFENLENRHFLHKVPVRGEQWIVELTHDLLATLAKSSRDRRDEIRARQVAEESRRRAEEREAIALKKRRQSRTLAMVMIGLAAITAGIAWLAVINLKEAQTQKGRADRTINIASTWMAESAEPETRDKAVAFIAQNLENEEKKSSLTLSTSLMTSLGFRSSYRMLRGAFSHGGKVQTVKFSPKGERMATGGNNEFVKVWDISYDEAPLFELNHESSVLCVAFHPVRPLLVSGGTSGIIRVWSLREETQEKLLSMIDLSTLLGEKGEIQVRSVEFSRDGALLAVALGHEKAGAPDVALLKLSENRLTLQNSKALHDGQGFDAIFEEDEKSILTCGWNLIEAELSLEKWREAAPFGLRIFNIDMLKGDSRVFMATADRNVVAVNLGQGPESGLGDLIESNRYKDQLRGLAVHPSGLVVVTGSDDGGVRFHDALSLEELGSPLMHPDYVRSVDIDPGGSLVATVCNDGYVRFWDIAAKGIITHNDGSGEFCRSVDYSKDGKLLAAGYRNGKVRIIDPVAVKKLAEFLPRGKSNSHPIRSLKYSPDGKWLAVAAGDVMKLYDAKTLGTPQSNARTDAARTMTAPGRIREICFGREGRFVAVCTDFTEKGHEGRIAVWDLDTAGAEPTAQSSVMEDREFYSVALSPDNRVIAGGGNSGTGIFLWSFPDLTPLDPHRLERANWVRGLDFHPNGSELASLSGLKLSIWDANTWEEKLSIAHSETVWSVKYNQDGNYLIVGGREVIRLRSIKSDYVEVDTRAIGVNNDCWDAAFQPGGNQISLAINDGVAFRRGPLISSPVDRNTVKLFRTLTGIREISDQGQITSLELKSRAADLAELQSKEVTFEPELIDTWAQWIISPEKQNTVDPQSSLTLDEYGAAKANAVLQFMELALRSGRKTRGAEQAEMRREKPSEWERENPRLATVSKQLHAVRLELLTHDPSSAIVEFLNLVAAGGEDTVTGINALGVRARRAVRNRKDALKHSDQSMSAAEKRMLQRVATILDLQGQKRAGEIVGQFAGEFPNRPSRAIGSTVSPTPSG